MKHPALALIEARTSINRFDAASDIDDEVIRDLVHYATQAPSAYNLQNWRFIAVKSADRKQVLMDAAYGQPKVGAAAVTFIVCGKLDPHAGALNAMQPFHEAGHISKEALHGWVEDAARSYRDDPAMQRDEAIRSASLAAMSLMLAAQAMGLASGPMIGFDPQAVKRAFDLGAQEIPVMLVAVGRAAAGNWPRKPRRDVGEVLSIV